MQQLPCLCIFALLSFDFNVEGMPPNTVNCHIASLEPPPRRSHTFQEASDGLMRAVVESSKIARTTFVITC